MNPGKLDNLLLGVSTIIKLQGFWIQSETKNYHPNPNQELKEIEYLLRSDIQNLDIAYLAYLIESRTGHTVTFIQINSSSYQLTIHPQ